MQNNKSSYILSKTSYIRGLQCSKSLYLDKNRPFLRDPISQEKLEKFRKGHVFGKIGQQLFPNGTLVSRPSLKSAIKTKELIENKTSVIYEACFISKKVISALDILVFENNVWNAYEIKSNSLIKDVYLNDTALQYFVINKENLKINKFFLVNRNPNNLLNDDISLDAFVFNDVTDFCKQNQDKVENKIDELIEVVDLKSSPQIEPSKHCLLPYECDFKGHCWKKLSPKEQEDIINSAENE